MLADQCMSFWSCRICFLYVKAATHHHAQTAIPVAFKMSGVLSSHLCFAVASSYENTKKWVTKWKALWEMADSIRIFEWLADVSLDFIRCYTVFLKYKLHLKGMLKWLIQACLKIMHFLFSNELFPFFSWFEIWQKRLLNTFKIADTTYLTLL